MQLEVNNGSMNVVFDVAEIHADVGQSAQLDVQQAINYIKSGEAEIASYVNGTAKPAIDAYVVSNAYPAISAYVTNTAEPNIDSYVANTIYPQFDTYIDLAKDWATKTDGSVDGVEYSAKYYAEQTASLVLTLAPVATSGSYNDLTDKPTIPTVNNATLTITQGGVSKGTFTANASSDVTIELDAGGGSGDVESVNGYTGVVVLTASDVGALPDDTVIPTDTSNLTNDAGFITSAALAGYATETWVGNQGYITGITSSDVTTALGYTPYDASNPSGYITSSALNGYATESYVTTATANMQTTGNLVTSISSASTDTQYPSAKCVYDIVGDIETLLSQV